MEGHVNLNCLEEGKRRPSKTMSAELEIGFRLFHYGATVFIFSSFIFLSHPQTLSYLPWPETKNTIIFLKVSQRLWKIKRGSKRT